MKRLTNKKKEKCRWDYCNLEEWMASLSPAGDYPLYPCDSCPVVDIVNKLAEYEDKEEQENG